MKRTIAAIVAGSVLAAALVSCSTEAPKTPKTGDKVSVSFSDWQFAEPGRGDRMKAVIADYNKSQNKCSIEDTTIPYPQYATTILTRLGAGSGPDLMNFDYDVWVLAQKSGFLADLGKKIVKPKDGFVDADAKVFVDGKRYGMVWETNAYALIVNTKLLSDAGVAVPNDWKSFTAAAHDLTKDGVYGFAFRNTMPEEAGWWSDLSTWVYGFGGQWTDKSGAPTANSAKVVKGVTEYVKFFADKVIPQGADAATYRTMFWEGKVAMMIDNGAVPGIVVAGNPDMKQNIKVVPQPTPTDAHLQTIFPLAVNAKASPEKQACAADFMNWSNEPAQQADLIVASGGLGVATPAATPSDYLKGQPWVETFRSLKNGVLLPAKGAEDKTAQIRHIVLSQVDKVMREGQSVQAAMDDAQSELKTLLGK
jgi:multiple sugar transport system substrate-binding protein